LAKDRQLTLSFNNSLRWLMAIIGAVIIALIVFPLLLTLLPVGRASVYGAATIASALGGVGFYSTSRAKVASVVAALSIPLVLFGLTAWLLASEQW
jgi:uncharacterized paraquat-inducible protein A